jgi:hypothetical protein
MILNICFRSRSATSNQLRNYKGALEEVLELLQMEPEFEYHTSQQEHAIPISTSSTHYVDQVIINKKFLPFSTIQSGRNG